MSSPMNVKANKRQRSLLCCIPPTVILLSAGFFFGSAFLITDYKQSSLRSRVADDRTDQVTISNKCEAQCRSDGSESLPEGIVTRTSNLEMRPLWGPPNKRKNLKAPMSLLAMAVGQKQKNNVNEIVKKFPEDDFVVMLFHYDGVVDDWKDFEWSSHTIHVSAIIKQSGGLLRGSYIQMSYQSMLTFFFGTKTLELPISMMGDINRGRHRSRKPVESRKGQAVSGTTNITEVAVDSSSSEIVTSGSGTSKSLSSLQCQSKSLQSTAATYKFRLPQTPS